MNANSRVNAATNARHCPRSSCVLVSSLSRSASSLHDEVGSIENGSPFLSFMSVVAGNRKPEVRA